MKEARSLSEIFLTLKQQCNYRRYIKLRVIKIILSGSVIRVFSAGSKRKLNDCLSRMNVDGLLKVRNQTEYDKWLHSKVNKIYKTLAQDPQNLYRLSSNGMRWGHSTKIFNLFIGHLLFYSPYFNVQPELKKIQYFLHVPLDKKVFKALKQCNVAGVPKTIKNVDAKAYKNMQAILREEGQIHKVPPLYFDEYAWAFIS